MNIKRFHEPDTFCVVREQSNGEYVLYTDHIAALEAVKATEVRALEWVKWTNQTGWQADTVIGQYQVAWFAEMEAFQLYKPNASASDRFTKFERSEAAKAAAQADYETRILSAIVPSPALEANQQVIETLRAALENVMGIYDTPLSRRRFPPDEFMKEALETARAALSPPTQGEV